MKTSYFVCDNGEYPIQCKTMLPDDGKASEIIIGVHGFAGDKESSAIEALAKEMTGLGAGVICFDFPAHGVNTADEKMLTVSNCKRDLLTVADYCREAFPEAEKAVFATSFGGYITLLCSSQLPEFRIILRAPAVTMPEHILIDILGVSAEQFRELGVVECGFERKISLPFAFYEDLNNNRVMTESFDREMLIIHGDCDDIVPRADIISFCEKNKKMLLFSVAGADHRFKKPGELEQVISAAKSYIVEGCLK